MKKRLLLTGASGFVGYNFQEKLSKDYKVFAHYNRNKFVKRKCTPCRFDLADSKALHNVFDEIKPHIVIHSAAISNVEDCEKNPSLAFKINRDITGKIAELCSEHNSKLVFLSTDIVFDGKKGNYVETDEVNPLNAYASSKAEAEEEIKRKIDDYLILRISLTYGLKNPKYKSFLDKMIDSLKDGRELNLFTDQIRCPNYAEDVAEIMLRLIEKKQKGIFHCAGPQALSRYEIGKIVVDTFNLDERKIKPVKVDEYQLPFKNGRDCSLNCQKAYSISGFVPKKFVERLIAVKKEY